MINQSEFEELIQQVIDGKITRRQISKQYRIDSRTINDKITELATLNPELYQDFISKFPFRPKEITNINFVELVKKIMKEEGTVEIIVAQYDVSTRTFRRRVKAMEKSDTLDELSGLTEKEIHDLYIKYRNNKLSFEEKVMIEEMKAGTITNRERTADRKKYLEDLLQQYHQLINQGIPKAEAAKNLGFPYGYMYKIEEELNRIKTENDTRQKMRNFKAEMRVSNTPQVDMEKIQLGNATIEIVKGEK